MRRFAVQKKNANSQYNDSKYNSGHSRRMAAADIYERETGSVFCRNETARIPRLAYHRADVQKSRGVPLPASDLYAIVRSRRRDKSPLATFYTGISIKFVRDKSCYTASGPALKASRVRARTKPDVMAADSSRTGHFQCCFIYCTCHTYRVVPTVGQGLIFQTGSPDTSAPVRLPRERRESHARFVALVPALVDAARWHHEILT